MAGQMSNIGFGFPILPVTKTYPSYFWIICYYISGSDCIDQLFHCESFESGIYQFWTEFSFFRVSFLFLRHIKIQFIGLMYSFGPIFRRRRYACCLATEADYNKFIVYSVGDEFREMFVSGDILLITHSQMIFIFLIGYY